MKLILTLSLLSVLSFGPTEESTSRSLVGKIVENGTNDELTGAKIEVLGTDIVVYSDRDGEFNLPDLPPESFVIRVSFISFKTQEIAFNSETSRLSDLLICLDSK